MLDQLVVTAGNAVVSAMAGDAWEKCREAVVSLWRRTHPERVETIAAELAEVREDILAARTGSDSETEHALAVDWQHRLRRLIGDDPRLADELRRVLEDELIPLLSPTSRDQIGAISIKTTTSGRGKTTILGQGTQHNY